MTCDTVEEAFLRTLAVQFMNRADMSNIQNYLTNQIANDEEIIIVMTPLCPTY